MKLGLNLLLAWSSAKNRDDMIIFCRCKLTDPLNSQNKTSHLSASQIRNKSRECIHTMIKMHIQDLFPLHMKKNACRKALYSHFLGDLSGFYYLADFKNCEKEMEMENEIVQQLKHGKKHLLVFKREEKKKKLQGVNAKVMAYPWKII